MSCAERNITSADDVLKLRSQRAVDPRGDDAVQSTPRSIAGMHLIGEDVVVESILLEGKQHVLTPSGVVGGCRVQNNRYEGPDALDDGHLAVESSGDGVGRRSRRGRGNLGKRAPARRDKSPSRGCLLLSGDGGLLFLRQKVEDGLDS